MKSSDLELKRRGHINKEVLSFFEKLSQAELLDHLQSKDASHRSAAFHILHKNGFFDNNHHDDLLLDALSSEKALYTKLEITSILEQGNTQTAIYMIKFLNEIRNNQYTSLPSVISKKESYPIPKDLIARVLGKMNPDIFPVLIKNLKFLPIEKLSELIDAVGYMSFYNPKLATVSNFQEIYNSIYKHLNNLLILWKFIILLSAFPISPAKDFLKKHSKHQIKTIQLEAIKSLNVITSSKK